MVVVATGEHDSGAAVNAVALGGPKIPSAQQRHDDGGSGCKAAQAAVELFSVPPGQFDIVDSNGAGDSFVGGYLAAHICGHPVDRCVAAGMFVAAECLQVRLRVCGVRVVPLCLCSCACAWA